MDRFHRVSGICAAVGVLAFGAFALLLLPAPEALAQQVRPAMTLELFNALGPEQRQAFLEERARDNTILIGVFLLFMAVMTAGMFFYAFRLHRNFLKICADNQQVAVFAQSPGGLPTGTFRGLMAAFIVLSAICFILLTIKGGPFEGFPEVMGGVLGTVLGFYFGTRTASGSQEREATRQISEVSQERNQAVVKVETSRLDKAVESVKEGLAVARTVKTVLPENIRGPAETVIAKVEDGLKVVDELRAGGNVGDAVEKAIGLVRDVSKGSGVAPLLAKAAGSFGAVLGGVVPPLAIAVAVATVAARLTGAAYERWMARVLAAPYTPALFPPTVIDANTGFVLLRKSPRFAEAFAEEIRQGNRQFIAEFVAIALSEAGSEAIQRKYPGRFASLQEVDEALQQFQQAAIELEVSKDITPEMTAEAGGTEALMRGIDRINGSPDARADLDALVLAIDKLRQADQPVEKIVRDARAEVEG